MSTHPGHQIDAEVFSVGTWNGEIFTHADLEELARNFLQLKEHLKPPLKFGHDEGQRLLPQQDGDPALGWVEHLRVVGDRLVATFAGIPQIVYDAIRAGRYRRVSAEIYFHVRQHGKLLGKALKAVALLGADLPAVTNLQDLTAFLSAAPPPAFQAGASAVFTLALGPAAEHALTEEKPAMSQLPTPEQLQAELLDLRAYRDQQEHLKAQERTRRKDDAFQAARDGAVRFCEEQVLAGRLSPHLRERLLREVEQQVHSFKEGGGLRVSFDWLREFVAQTPPRVAARELGHDAPATVRPLGAEDPSMTLSRLAGQRMVEMNLTYSQAAEYVLKAHPDLARAYRDYTMNLSLGG